MSGQRFPDAPRVDAHAKVRGEALFAADDSRPEMAHAALAIATVGKGRITAIDTGAASAVAGVRLVLTHQDLSALEQPGFLFAGGFGFQSIQAMSSPAVAYRGQPIALVAADTLEAAIEGASRVIATYAPEAFNVLPDHAPAADVVAQAESPLPREIFFDRTVGDADKAFAEAPVKVEAVFTSPPQHQNPMELLGTIAEWRREP